MHILTGILIFIIVAIIPIVEYNGTYYGGFDYGVFNSNGAFKIMEYFY